MVGFLQALDGIGAGIYSVAIVAFAADLTRRKGQFNSLLGTFATAQTIGGVVGPIVSGLVLQDFGFNMTFIGFASAHTACRCNLPMAGSGCKVNGRTTTSFCSYRIARSRRTCQLR